MKNKNSEGKEEYNEKVIKFIIIFGLIFVLFICCLSLYIGNYLYDYTLNPYSDHTLLENLKLDEETKRESQKWMEENSQDIYIKSYDQLKLHAYSIQQESHVYMIMVHGYKGDGTSIISPVKE